MRFYRSAYFLTLLTAALGVRAQSTVPTLTREIPAQTVALGAPVALDLRDFFSLPGVSGQIAQLDTVRGKFNIELLADDAPRTVANFLNYVNRGAYTNSLIHRSVPNFVIQGGGYVLSGTNISSITTDVPVQNEYKLSNVRGTLAMAKNATGPNTATSQWFVNLADNSANLNNQNGGFTVFARVLGTGMTVVDSIAAVPAYDASAALGGDFTSLPLLAANLSVDNFILTRSISVLPVFPTASGGGVLTFTLQNSAPAVVNPVLSGSTLTLNVIAAGSAIVTVRASDVNGNFAESAFTITARATVPVFTTQPASQVVATGSTLVLNAIASDATSYQWQRDGVDLSGATASTLYLNNASAATAGRYTCIAVSSSVSATSAPAVITVTNAAPADVGRLINLAIRTNAGTGAQTLIVGFAVGGAGTSGTTPLLVRAIGPGLTQFGVGGVLADPVATMFQGSTSVATNDNWGGTAAIVDRSAQVGAFQIPGNSLDAALAVSPAPGTFSVQVTGNPSAGSGQAGTGLALAEIYDATAAGAFSAATPRLVNVSARTQVGTGGDILIAGFVVGGTTSRTVLIRAIGPTLAAFGVPGTLADPKLQLFSGSKLINENDDWGGDALVASIGGSVGAFALADGKSKDAVLLVTLPPGNYGAQVSGANAGTGVALVEVYEVP